jgi:hypothetical protein
MSSIWWTTGKRNGTTRYYLRQETARIIAIARGTKRLWPKNCWRGDPFSL